MRVTRRDVLGVGAGAAAGVILTPAPWRLIDDVAIWTQNWSWIPKPPRGPESLRATACSLCPAGCAVQARCIGSHPVSLRGLPADPISRGALCPLGQGGHHLAWHPARIERTMRIASSGRTYPVPHAIALDELRKAIARAKSRREAVAVLDTRPGRAASFVWSQLLAALPNAFVVPAPGRAGASMNALAAMTGAAGAGIDAANAATLVSFGAPLAEGWGSIRWSPHSGQRLIQIEPLGSATAAAADEWLPVRPGTEGALALALAHVLIGEGLAGGECLRTASDGDAYLALVSSFSPAAVAEITGIRAERIAETARAIAQARPAIVLAGEDPAGGRHSHATETAILGLNLLLGSYGVRGGIVPRGELPDPMSSRAGAPLRETDEVDDGSIAVLLIDASDGDAAFPWPLVKRKLARNATVAALSPFLAGSARHAAVVFPAPAFLEDVHEIPAPFDAPAATFAVSSPLMPRRDGSIDAMQLARELAPAAAATFDGSLRKNEDVIRMRAAAIHARGRGSVTNLCDRSAKPVSEIETADAMWEALVGGGRWTDDAASTGIGHALRPSLLRVQTTRRENLEQLAEAPARDPQRPLTLVVHDTRDASASAAVSPLLTKLYQESGLRRSPRTAAVNPQTAARFGLRDGAKARLATAAGAMQVTVVADRGVMPDLVVIAAGPLPLSLGSGARDADSALDLAGMENGFWRCTSASLVEA